MVVDERVVKECVYPTQKHELMNHVAHQTIVMQFILELAKSLDVDPRGCVRAFFSRCPDNILNNFPPAFKKNNDRMMKLSARTK